MKSCNERAKLKKYSARQKIKNTLKKYINNPKIESYLFLDKIYETENIINS